MKRELILLSANISIFAGCSGVLFGAYAEEQVKPNPVKPGYYIVYYNWTKLLNEFGPGVEAVRSAVATASDVNEKEAIWDREYMAAALRLLEKKKLIPAECKSHIEIIGARTVEGGGGAAEFRCI